MPIAPLILQGLLFIAWAACAFRWLFHLRRRGMARSGAMFPGPGAMLRAIGAWARDPAERSFRWLLIGLTVALMGTNILFAVTLA